MRRIVVWSIVPLAVLAGCESSSVPTDVSADTSVGSPPSRAELLWLPSAVSVGGPAASVAAPVRFLAVAGGTVVYDALPDPAPASWPSFSFQETGTDEWGDHVVLTEAGTLGRVRVGLSSWACENDPVRAPSEACVSTPGSSFSHPVTLDVYEADLSGAVPAVGPLLASSTEVFDIPFRPSYDPACFPPAFDAPYGGQWYDAASGRCVSGFAVVVEFDFSGAAVSLPGQVIYGVAWNTESHGDTPVGAPGPWNRLTLGVANAGSLPGPTVGSDAESDYTFWDSDFGSWYCDGGAGGVDVFRRDGCWGGLTPIVEFELGAGDDQGPVTSEVSPAPSPALLASPVSVSAVVDDGSTGGSPVASAEVQVVEEGAAPVSGGWQPAAASDGAFDGVSEAVTAQVTPSAAGAFEVCVRGSDASGNVGDPACAPLMVIDPDAGSVQGNGWIPSGASNKARDGLLFGVQGSYPDGADTPDGMIRIHDLQAGIDVETDALDWMAVADDGSVTMVGRGVLNGSPVIVEAWMGDGTGLEGADVFGARIRSVGGDEAVLLDTGGVMSLGGGRIQVRR